MGFGLLRVCYDIDSGCGLDLVNSCLWVRVVGCLC